MTNIATCLWFDDRAEEAAKLYTSIFENSKVIRTSRYGESGAEVSGQEKGSVMTVDLQLENLEVQCLNAGPIFKFSPSLSFFVYCANEAEMD